MRARIDLQRHADGGGTVHATAPPGYRFAASDTHTLAASWGRGEDHCSAAAARAALGSDLADGFHPCPPGGDCECRAVDCAGAPRGCYATRG